MFLLFFRLNYAPYLNISCKRSQQHDVQSGNSKLKKLYFPLGDTLLIFVERENMKRKIMEFITKISTDLCMEEHSYLSGEEGEKRPQFFQGEVPSASSHKDRCSVSSSLFINAITLRKRKRMKETTEC